MKPIAQLAVEGDLAAISNSLRKLAWMLQDECQYEHAKIAEVAMTGHHALMSLRSFLVQEQERAKRLGEERDRALGILGG